MVSRLSIDLIPPASEDTLLFTGRKATSSCTGAATSEMALAVVEKTINDAGGIDGRLMDFRISSAHET